MISRFIQIHWLASYPATLLNRDDAGRPNESRLAARCDHEFPHSA